MRPTPKPTPDANNTGGAADPTDSADSADSAGSADSADSADSAEWQRMPGGLLLRTPTRNDLWIEGDARLLRCGPRVAIIGSRTPTAEQVAVAAMLSDALCEAGAAVCSGGALGIDGVAHRAALRNGGVTALVSPVAPGRTYPARHAGLFDEVRERGVVISPFAPGTPFSRAHFRVRNVVLARLVDAVIVICADRRSGSLHCARQAWKLGLPVFGVPWNPGSLHAEGTNLLLHAGARAVASGQQAAQVVERLRAAGSTSWLLRDATAPVWESSVHSVPVRRGRDPAKRERAPLNADPNAADARLAIDGERGRWQRYAPAGQRPTNGECLQDESQLAELKALSAMSALDDDGAVRLALRQTRDGISLERLVADTGRPRADLARLLLGWTLMGTARRDPWGRYHDG